MLTFQQIILKLQSYWDAQGCALLQPYDMEVGAGTSHTATFLRAIGPEPWKAAYVQPSRRPKDGRYGENPNRLQHYYQYQVVLKPAPANILELYLGSLEALGFDLKKNDIRFVEDDWENPTLGAWGLGWEVWLNGMEVTQFTYFQQVGGIDCKPATGEITYGLERLAMLLQGVDNIYETDQLFAVIEEAARLSGKKYTHSENPEDPEFADDVRLRVVLSCLQNTGYSPSSCYGGQPMFSHIQIGARDVPAMTLFYDTVLTTLGLVRLAHEDIDNSPAGAGWQRPGHYFLLRASAQPASVRQAKAPEALQQRAVRKLVQPASAVRQVWAAPPVSEVPALSPVPVATQPASGFSPPAFSAGR